MEMGMQTATESVLNFRKMRHDFPPPVLKEGKALFDKAACLGARIASYSPKQFVIEAKVVGHFQDTHLCSIEVDRVESAITYSTCDCAQGFDCQHLACLVFFLEEHFHSMLLAYLGKIRSKASPETDADMGEVEKRLKARARREQERQLVADYSKVGEWLAQTSLFRTREEKVETGELMALVGAWNGLNGRLTEVQLAVRLTGRAKPVLIQQPKAFLSALQQHDPLILGNQRVVLDDASFGEKAKDLVDFLRREFDYLDKGEKVTRGGYLSQGALFAMLSLTAKILDSSSGEKIQVFFGSLDRPLQFSATRARPSFAIEMLAGEDQRLVLKPFFSLPRGKLPLSEVKLVLASPPGVLSADTYYPLEAGFSFRQAVELSEIDHYAIPKALFPTFLAYALPYLQKLGDVVLPEAFHPIGEALCLVDPKAICHAELCDGEMSLDIRFKYGDVELPEIRREHSLDQIFSLSSETAVVPRNPMKELLLTQELVWGLSCGDKEGKYTTKSEKRIIDFVCETLPTMGDNVEWHISESLKRCFCFESSKIRLLISESDRPGLVRCRIKVEGPLKGVDVARVLEASRSRRTYIETTATDQGIGGKKFVVLPAEEIEALGIIIEDFAIPSFKESDWLLPIWSVVWVDEGPTMSSQVEISCAKPLKELQKNLLSPKAAEAISVPQRVKGTLRPYQHDGVQWLRRLRDFGLGGILADDMGLGKTIQAICALSEVHSAGKAPPSLIICPTSLVDNWKEELNRFDAGLKVITFVGAPGERRRLLSQKKAVDVFVTSYGLVQRDLELFEAMAFSYVILDEAQAIKNRETQNARSVKKLNATHRLVLTGTPVENSLEDLWSLFDFLMPGFLGSHDRFIQTYIRPYGIPAEKALDVLKKKVAPFVLRRMKQDVLDDLPPISHIVYYCYLHDEQQKMYHAAAKKAKEHLVDLVEREGFDKARLHVLATLTRLKQICCHPVLVQSDGEPPVRSAKYEMLQDLLGVLISGGHKTVLFSQYTKMLGIIRDDLAAKTIPYLYLDGSTKNRLRLVKQFNEDLSIPVFLVSLRAGGNGLNLVGADSVIHYDMWWNPAVENQATDRVWRMGQKTKVSSYKLITKGSIEETIFDLQERKKDLISGIVQSDEDVLSKLTWEDVLSLLKCES